jgi:hypothetical protein
MRCACTYDAYTNGHDNTDCPTHADQPEVITFGDPDSADYNYATDEEK